MEYHLICEAGRLDAPGRPILFATTEEFFPFSLFDTVPSSDVIMLLFPVNHMKSPLQSVAVLDL